jgi:hypothetical protein
MRNKTVNSAALEGGGKRMRADAIYLSCHRQIFPLRVFSGVN